MAAMLVVQAIAACSPRLAEHSEKVVWRLEIDASSSFVVLQDEFPIARDTLVSTATSGRLVAPSSPEDLPWNVRCAWTYARYFAWTAALDSAWRADGLKEEEWQDLLLGTSPRPHGGCHGPTEWWNDMSSANHHAVGAAYVCDHATTSTSARGRCAQALSLRAAADDFAVLLGDSWRFGEGIGGARSPPFYSEQIRRPENDPGSVFSAEVHMGDALAYARCTSHGRGADASVGAQVAVLAALAAVGQDSGNEYHLPDLALRWRSFDLAHRLPGGAEIDWGQNAAPYAQQVLALVEERGDWTCTTGGA